MSYTEIEIPENLLEEFKEIIKKNSGIAFTETNLPVLISRIRRLLKRKNIDDPKRFLEILKTDIIALRDFVDFVTTNYTFFYRYPEQFEVLQKVILPNLLEEKFRNREFKIKEWSAGCATGEEPYSMAIVTMEAIEQFGLYMDFSVWASDISLQSIMDAKEGVYKIEKLKNLPQNLLEKYFEKITDDTYEVKEEVKKHVIFDYHNLLYDHGIRDVDIVFCRNVLIYMDENSQKEVLRNIYNAMKEGGYLFLAPSETAIQLSEKFKLEKINNYEVFVYRKIK